MTKRDRKTEWQKMTEEQKKTEWQNEQKGQKDKKDRRIKNGRTETKGQKEIYYVNMILLWLRIYCNVEIYSNYATTCCTIDLNSNVSYEIRESMVLTTSNLLSFCVFQFCCHCYHSKTQANSLVYRGIAWNVKSDSKSKQNLYCEKCNSFSC